MIRKIDRCLVCRRLCRDEQAICRGSGRERGLAAHSRCLFGPQRGPTGYCLYSHSLLYRPRYHHYPPGTDKLRCHLDRLRRERDRQPVPALSICLPQF